MTPPNATAERGERGHCPACRRVYTLAPSDGTVRFHRVFRGGPQCHGGGEPPIPAADCTVPPASQREAQILELIASGHKDARIAKDLFLSVHTVKSHVRTLMARFGALDRTALIVKATLRGVLIPCAHGDRLIASDEATATAIPRTRLQLEGLVAHYEARPHHPDY